MVGFGFEQGLSDLETAGIVDYFEDFQRAKTPLGAKRCRLSMGTDYAPVAQGIGRQPPELKIAGSNPAGRTKNKKGQ